GDGRDGPEEGSHLGSIYGPTMLAFPVVRSLLTFEGRQVAQDGVDLGTGAERFLLAGARRRTHARSDLLITRRLHLGTPESKPSSGVTCVCEPPHPAVRFGGIDGE